MKKKAWQEAVVVEVTKTDTSANEAATTEDKDENDNNDNSSEESLKLEWFDDGTSSKKVKLFRRSSPNIRFSLLSNVAKSEDLQTKLSERPSRIQMFFMSALDPYSELVYYLVNVSVVILLVVLFLMYYVYPSIHFVVMWLLAFGLLASVNLVWLYRDPNAKKKNSSANGLTSPSVGQQPLETEQRTESVLSSASDGVRKRKGQK
ncbi:hypothetical protein RFI_28159 [Reticulomyxa filosa]|uniref:Uncharacterized protein n=1 Tax=Reticulomyxa filosa TaxID=46433 RepID=X6M6Y1_RETFI|nr:hypothetical protein RFI_28159 [Reticulomyxa filosa]|eukprot:ETO09227.1 hypothetical protein RFI_28159 [Reticulomyxa filosa]